MAVMDESTKMTDMDDEERKEAIGNAVAIAFDAMLTRAVAGPEDAGKLAATRAFNRALERETARTAKRRRRADS